MFKFNKESAIKNIEINSTTYWGNLYAYVLIRLFLVGLANLKQMN